MTTSPAAPGLVVHLAEPHMLCRRPFLIATVVLACLATLVGAAHAGQPTTPQDDTDGQFRTELTLGARQISVAYNPALRADDAVQAVLLTAPSVSTESGVLVARVTGPRTLRIGRLGPDPEPKVAPASGLKHDLWLTRTPEGWVLDARPVEEAEPEPGPESEPEAEPEPEPEAEPEPESEPGADADADKEDPAPEIHPESSRIPLRHRETQVVADTLSVVLEPTGDDTGHLMLRWGAHLWTTDFEFVELPRRPRPERPPGPPRGRSLTRDSDTSARARAATLGTRNETALWTSDGAHIQVLFHKETGTDGDDYAGIETTADGDVVQLTQAAVIRLRTEVSLRFGQTLMPTGNLSPDFPGAYALWLKKTGSGWQLVFNNEPDSWGSQHDPAFDAAAIDLSYARVEPAEPDRPLAVYIAPLGVEENRLIIHWGVHVWTADFTIGQ